MLFPTSCTQDAYEKGEGEYSLMRGDFAEAQVDGNRRIISITTDDGDYLPLADAYTAKWIAKADTTYRCLLYYNKVEKSYGQYMAEVISLGQVPCPAIKKVSELESEFRTDPVKFESLWRSKSGKYENLSLLLKTGVTDDTTAVQRLALVADTVVYYPNHTSTRHVLLHHDQDNVPEYYSTKTYLSIPTDSIGADSLRITINTYNGPVVKTISLQGELKAY